MIEMDNFRGDLSNVFAKTKSAGIHTATTELAELRFEFRKLVRAEAVSMLKLKHRSGGPKNI